MPFFPPNIYCHAVLMLFLFSLLVSRLSIFTNHQNKTSISRNEEERETFYFSVSYISNYIPSYAKKCLCFSLKLTIK